MTLPTGWERVDIGDLCDLINGKAFKPTDWAKNGLPIIRIQNLNRPDAEFNYCDQEVDERFLVDTGELLFAWSGTPGTSFGAHVWNGPRAVLNQHIFRVRFDEAQIDRDFFKHAINSTLGELIGKPHGGVGLAHVTKGKFEATEIVLPPTTEQRRIVAKLDALTARLSRARAELDSVPVLAEHLRQAALNRAVSGEMTRDLRDGSDNADVTVYPDLDDQERGVWHVETLPATWTWVDFDEFFDDRTDSKRKLAEKEYDSDGAFPVVDQGQRPIGGYTNRKDLVHPVTEPVVIFGDHTRCVKLVIPPFVQGADGVKVELDIQGSAMGARDVGNYCLGDGLIDLQDG